MTPFKDVTNYTFGIRSITESLLLNFFKFYPTVVFSILNNKSYQDKRTSWQSPDHQEE
jgi:hypothetical protein